MIQSLLQKWGLALYFAVPVPIFATGSKSDSSRSGSGTSNRASFAAQAPGSGRHSPPLREQTEWRGGWGTNKRWMLFVGGVAGAGRWRLARSVQGGGVPWPWWFTNHPP